MPRKKKKHFDNSIERHIKASQKEMSVMFTDIEESTRYWDTRGDIKGRMMVDMHNRLIFPVVRKFNGKVVKTIGDAIMAVFRKPDHAISAAIGIQQMLRRSREEEKNFNLKVRIGIHTGKVIAEHNDVYGDVVNVASRVESQGKGDEILISQDTHEKLKKEKFVFVRGGSFKPKGKKKALKLYRCKWMDEKSVIDRIRVGSFLPLTKRQKLELLAYSFAGVGILYFLFFNYLRYLIVDYEVFAIFSLNPQIFINVPPTVPMGIGAIFVLLMILLIRMATIPHFILRLIKGGFGLCVGFFLIYVPVKFLDLDVIRQFNNVLYRSEHLFVEVLENDSTVHKEPDQSSEALQTVNSGMLLLLTDVKRVDELTWNKVLVGEDNFGWIPRVVPPKIGVPEKRISIANKFYFKYLDLGALIFGFLGFLWGVWNFKIRPA